MKNLILVAVLLLIVSSLSFGQGSTPAGVTVTVNSVITVEKITDLLLGSVNNGATQTVLSTGSTAAAFKITGAPNTQTMVTVAFPGTLTGPGAPMTFTGQIPIHNTTNIQGGASTLDFALTGGTTATHLTSGELYIWIGGGVTAALAQAAGSYSGTINVSVTQP